MPFDVQGAKQAGASDDQILQHLTSTRNFDVQGALKAGANKQDIINYLANTPAKKPGADHFLNPNNPNTPKQNAELDSVKTSPTADFLAALPGAAADTVLKSPAKLATSAGEGFVQTLKTGGRQNASGKTYNIPGLAPFKSFQSDAADRAAAGQGPVKNAAEAALGIGGATLDTLALGEGASEIPDAADRVITGAKNAASATIDALKSRGSQKALDEALDVTKPLLDKKASITALENAGKPGGTGANLQITNSPHDVEVAKSVQGLVKKGASAAENNTAINKEISRVSEQEITPFLEKNQAPFNQKTFSAYLDKTVQPANFIKADPVLQSTYDLTKQALMDEVAKYPKTTKGLWDARISFDKVAENQVGKLDPQSEKVSAIKQAVLDVRKAANKFIVDRTPNGEQMFGGQMKRLTNMYEARSNIAENNYKLVNKGFFSRFKVQHPTATKVLKGAAKLAGLGAAVKEGSNLLH